MNQTDYGSLGICESTDHWVIYSQPFWGDMVANAGAGPRPIPHRQLNAENLAQAIKYCLSPQAVTAAKAIATKMELERGVKAAADSWWKQLPRERMQCDLVPSQPAVWVYNKSKRPIKLSKTAAAVLMIHDAVQLKHLSASVYSHVSSNFSVPEKLLTQREQQISEQPHNHRRNTLGPHLWRCIGRHGYRC